MAEEIPTVKLGQLSPLSLWPWDFWYLLCLNNSGRGRWNPTRNRWL